MKKAIAALLTVLLCFSLSVPAFAKAPLNYLLLGDSIAEGYGIENSDEACYGRIVADTNGYAYDNFAVPGHTTQNLLQRMQNEQVKTAIADADIISISIGGNNFLLGNLNALLYDAIVKEDYTRFDEIADRFYDDLQQIIETIRQLNPDAAILLQTIYNPQTGYVGEVYQQGANRFNDLFRQYAAEHPEGILLVDVAQVLTDSDHDFAEDRIHPSAVGNEKIVNAAIPMIKLGGTIGVYGVISQPTLMIEKGKGPYNFNLVIHQWPTRWRERMAMEPLCKWIKEGRLSADEFVTHRFKLSELGQALAAVKAGEALKVMMRF